MFKQTKTRGRPKDTQKTLNILVAARKLFLEKGIDVTNEEICQKAEVAKATLYTHFKDKASILEAVILNESTLTFSNKDYELSKEKPVRTSLEIFGIKYLTFVNNRELLRWDRLIAETSLIYPNMPAHFFNAGPARGQNFLIAIISDAISKQELKVIDAQIAADNLNGLWLGFKHLEIRLGITLPLNEDQIKFKVLNGIEVFMSAYKP